MLMRPEVDETEAKSMKPRPIPTRPRPTLTRLRPNYINFLAKFYILVPFSFKKQNFWSIFGGTSKILAHAGFSHGDYQ